MAEKKHKLGAGDPKSSKKILQKHTYPIVPNKCSVIIKTLS